MGIFLYNIFLLLYKVAIRMASPFNSKAKKWLQGRENVFEKLEAAIPAGEKVIWMHCSSLGEFEQGRPVIERLKAEKTGHKILLTFFSPSGYQVRQDYDGVDWVFYLPMDGACNARRFLEIVNPSLVIFVKYDFWYYYLKKIKYRNISLLLISALFRKEMPFFKWYGGVMRRMLSRFDHLFVQNAASKKLLDDIGLENISSISGDTRFDRVIEIADQFQPITAIEQFIGSSKTIVAGSTWKEDEELLQKTLAAINDPSLKLIIAPHEIDDKHLAEIKVLFPEAVFFSDWQNNKQPAISNQVLVINNMGMLSRLYKYAYLTYIGGGLKPTGVHNVLEPAVYSKIVLMGPYYHKYNEATELLQSGGGLALHDDKNNDTVLRELIQALLKDETEYTYRSNAAGNFVRNNQGATDKIMQFIQEKRLLTN